MPSQGDTNVLGRMLEKYTLKLWAKMATDAVIILLRMFSQVCRPERGYPNGLFPPYIRILVLARL